MELSFDTIISKHSNEDCIIVGSGHTMNKFDYLNFKGQIIFCGSAILRLENINPNYLISCNNHFPIINIKSHLNILNQYPAMTWIFSDTCAYGDIWDFNKKDFNQLKPNYITFDDRHFGMKKCSPKKKCCKFLNIYKNRKNITEIVEEKFEYKLTNKKLKSITVAEKAFMVALLMGFKNIYFQGIDLPTKKYQAKSYGKRYYGFENNKADLILDECLNIVKKKYFYYHLLRFDFTPYLKSIFRKIKIFFFKNYSDFANDIFDSLYIFKWLSQIAYKNKINIFNLSPISNLDKIKEIKTISLK